MAKTKRRKKTVQQRKTNWTVIGGVIGVGIIGLFALLYFTLQQAEALTFNEYCQENPSYCVSVGDENAPVTIVEILDFGCSHCRDFHTQTAPALKSEYVATGQARFLYLPYALNATTMPASNASLCAAEQNAYEEFSDMMFAQFGQPDAFSDTNLLSIGERLELDMDAYGSCVRSGKYEDNIVDNINLANRKGVRSTPSFFVNGTSLVGAQPFTSFQTQIERELNNGS